MAQRLLPTGECWCGCNQETGVGSFFLPGHDKFAESGVILMKFGGVPELLVHHGYGPGDRNLRQDFENWKKEGGRGR